jgi:hypothetical protein
MIDLGLQGCFYSGGYFMTMNEETLALDQLSREDLGNVKGGLPYDKPQLIVFRAASGTVTCKDGQKCSVGNSTCNTGYYCNSGNITDPEQ